MTDLLRTDLLITDDGKIAGTTPTAVRPRRRIERT
jgi:hypothetical protein